MANSTAAEDPVQAGISDYIALLKPGVMSLVVFTGLAGLWIAPGAGDMHPLLALMSIVALTLGAGAAGAINMWAETDLDAKMRRTSERPLPQGRIEPDDALGLGVVLSIFAVVMMALAANWLAAVLLALANLYYVFIYTLWLKPRTPQNIVIGGAAGAFPPVIGWAAVTGSIDVLPLILFAIIFMWTPPHFWALALFSREDYDSAGLPMLPNVAGIRATKIQMLVYTLLLAPLAMAPWLLGYAGLLYGAISILLSTFFVIAAIRVLQDTGTKAAKIMFGYSVFYLFALFLALMLTAV
jgi:protoheme IX farnesyltransferase